MPKQTLGRGTVLNVEETALIDRAFFIAVHHRRLPDETEPTADRARELFTLLRRAMHRPLSSDDLPESVDDAPEPGPEQEGSVLIPEAVWPEVCAALRLAAFDDDMWDADFQTIIGWPQSAFHELLAECGVVDPEDLRGWLFQARARDDGNRHRKLLAFAVDYLELKPRQADLEFLAHYLTRQPSQCDITGLTQLLKRARAAKAGGEARR